MTTATAGYRAEMDVLGQFIEDCCLTGASYRVKASVLYDTYKRWCEQNGEPIAVQRAWGMALTERGFERYPNNGTWYRSIAVRESSGEEARNNPRKERNHTEPNSRLNHIVCPARDINRKSGSVPSVPSVPTAPPAPSSPTVPSVESGFVAGEESPPHLTDIPDYPVVADEKDGRKEEPPSRERFQV